MERHGISEAQLVEPERLPPRPRVQQQQPVVVVIRFTMNGAWSGTSTTGSYFWNT
jgi:hypothetical protein